MIRTQSYKLIILTYPRLKKKKKQPVTIASFASQRRVSSFLRPPYDATPGEQREEWRLFRQCVDWCFLGEDLWTSKRSRNRPPKTMTSTLILILGCLCFAQAICVCVCVSPAMGMASWEVRVAFAEQSQPQQSRATLSNLSLKGTSSEDESWCQNVETYMQTFPFADFVWFFYRY